MENLAALGIAIGALLVMAFYLRRSGRRPDPLQRRRERYRARRERAPDRPIDPTFQFDQPDPEQNDKPSGPT